MENSGVVGVPFIWGTMQAAAGHPLAELSQKTIQLKFSQEKLVIHHIKCLTIIDKNQSSDRSFVQV